MTPTFWLSCHVDYACRHSGACCRAGWPLPVEAQAVPPIGTAVSSGRIPTIDGRLVWLQESGEAPDGMAGTFRQVAGACVFHVPSSLEAVAREDARHCGVHAALGHAALPSSCQHFPRLCLIDARGVRVSLSHFCPTAAAMLVDDSRPVTIVTGPPAVPGLAVPEGLDVRDALPPRLNHRMLMDLDALTRWEARVVAALAGPDAWPGPVEDVLGRLTDQAGLLAQWTPTAGALAGIIEAFHPPSAPGDARDAISPTAAFAIGHAACRPPWTWPALPPDLAAADRTWVAPRWIDSAPVVRRFLAGKAFGSWMTYQSDATGGLMAWLALALTVLRVECVRACAADGQALDRARLVTAVRQADLLLVHYADGGRLADALMPA